MSTSSDPSAPGQSDTDIDHALKKGLPAVPGSPAVLHSAALFGRSNEVRIEHQGVFYRLRKTALGKLILTK